MEKIFMMPINIECAVIEGDILWTFASEFNGLFSKNLKTDTWTAWGSVPGEDEKGKRLYACMKMYREKLYLIPYLALEMAVLDISKGTFEKIKLSKDESKDIYGSMVAEIYQEKLFIFHANKPYILEMNLETGEQTYLTDWFDDLKEMGFDQAEIFFRAQVVKVEDRIYAPIACAKAVLELNCETLQTKIHKLGEDQLGFAGIDTEDGKEFWLVPRRSQGSLVKWNLNGNIKEYWSIASANNPYAYVGIMKRGNRAMVFPGNNQKECFEQEGTEFIVSKGQYTFVQRCRDMIMTFEAGRGQLLVWKQNAKNPVYIDIKIPVQENYLKKMANKDTLNEKNGMDINMICGLMCEGKAESPYPKVKSIGAEIYKKIIVS